MAESKHIVVIGAGVIGLQIALSLLEVGHKVTVLAKHLPGDKSLEYTSPWAGAQWRPHGGPDDQEMMDWDIASLQHWTSIIENEKAQDENKPKSGLGMYESVEYCWAEERPWYAEHVSRFVQLNPNTCPEGTRVGFKYDSIMINVPQYLQYLLQAVKDHGATVIQETLPTSSGLEAALLAAVELANLKSADFPKEITMLVNATGLGAAKLVPDSTMYPVRGHTITVLGEAKRITTNNYQPDPQKPGQAIITYILPRPHSNTTVIGGTKQIGSWDPNPDEQTTQELLNRAKIFAPELLDENGQFTIVSTQVGLRPGRKQGPRIELEKVGDLVVCHAYGHAGAGYQNSIGTAMKVGALLKSTF